MADIDEKEFELTLYLMGFKLEKHESSTAWIRHPDFDVWKLHESETYVLYDSPGEANPAPGGLVKYFTRPQLLINYILKHE